MSDDIRKYITLIETYNNLIRYPAGMVSMSNMSASDPYSAYRMSINLANEDENLEPTEMKTNSAFIFFSKQARENAEKLFRKNNEPYEEITSSDSQEESDVHKVSPVASDRFAKKKNK